MMYLCTSCLTTDDREFQHCPTCGSPARAKLNRDNVLVEIPAVVGLPCQRCLATGSELRFRRFRRVFAYIFEASIRDTAGYFCPGCVRKMFFVQQGTTLITGWWGILSMLVFNPFAIILNFYGLAAAPPSAGALGAIDLDDLQSAEAQDEAFEDLYASLSTWLDGLSEEESDLVMSETDYYAVLGVAQDASQAEIKAAFRSQARLNHPDTGTGGGNPDRMVQVIFAEKVLGDARLRYAYDHVSKVLTESEPATDPDSEITRWGLECRYCGIRVDDIHEGISHLDRFHSDMYVVDPKSAFDWVEGAA